MLTRIAHANGVVTWQSPMLAAMGVPHGFSTRVGGVSGPPFESLNLGNPALCDAPDAKEHLVENYARLQEAILPGAAFGAWTAQVHGVRVIQIEAEPEAEYAESLEAMIADRFHGQIEADGMLTDISRLFLTVRTADCVPVLFADVSGRFVAAVHAGWRGVAGNIMARLVRAFGECDVAARGLTAAIGPHISAAHFEVGPEVAEAFERADLAAAIRRDLGERPHIDLQAALRVQLQRLGVERVDTTEQCTFANAADFFSHRRDRGITGRMAAVIAPNG